VGSLWENHDALVEGDETGRRGNLVGNSGCRKGWIRHRPSGFAADGEAN